MDRLIAMEKAKLKSAKQVDAPFWFEPLATAIQNIPIQQERVRMYQGNKLDDTYKSLVGLLDAADSEAGMKIYEKGLAEFASEAQKFGGYEDNIMQAETLKMLGSQKNQQRIDFGTGVQQASDFIDSGEYLSTQSDFENLFQTVDSVNAKRKADNKNPHDGVLEYIVAEKQRTLSLMDKILPGIQFNKDRLITGTNFTYNKANNNDKDTARKIVEYYNRLELTTKTLAGDGIITPDEAKAILIGDMDDYIKTRDTALAREKGLYTGNKTLFARYSGYVNKARQTSLKALQSLQDDFTIAMPGDMGDSEYAIMGEEFKKLAALGEDATEDDWKSIITSLKQQRDAYKALMNTANEKYKYWSGGYYEGGDEADDEFMIAELAKQMGVTPDKYMELQKGASDAGMSIDEFVEFGKEGDVEGRKKEIIKGTGVIGLPDVGSGITTPTGGEPFAVSELHKPVTPETPTMPTGEPDVKVPEELKPSYIAGINSMHKELAKKHKTPIKNIKSLWNDYNADDDIKMTFEDYAGEAFITTPEEKKVKGVSQLTKEIKGKRVINYDVANSTHFKRQQADLKNIASSKFKSLSKEDKKNYGNVRDFVKAKYKDWLKRTGKYGKGAWYTEGDFKYFFPTKVGPKGTTTNVSGVDIYDLFDRRLNMHPAFKKVTALPTATTSPSYEKFAKDFDDFRKFLQEF